MSARDPRTDPRPDVYEELIRRAARHINHCNEAEAHGAPLAAETARRLSEYTMQIAQLVEFLRWRDAREEWPAEGCRCLIVAEFPDGGVDVDVAIVMEQARAQAKRWRYVLGPCSCAKEG